MLNLGAAPQGFRRPADVAGLIPGRVVLSTFLDREGEAVGPTVEIRGNEGVIVELLGNAGNAS